MIRISSAAAVSWLAGCGGGSGEASAASVGGTGAVAAPNPPTVGSSALPALPVGRYRPSQPILLQAVPQRYIASRIPSGSDFLWDRYGPTHRYVDFHTGWLWSQPGGDWLDATESRHGSIAWFSIPVDKAIGSTTVAAYQGDVTAALKFLQSKNRWCAFLLKARNAPRTIAGNHHPSQPAPFVDVTYSDGQVERLACRVVAVNSASSTGPATTVETYSLPCFIEFERPRREVDSARFGFIVTEHWSGSNPLLEGFVLDPPVNNELALQGIAAAAGTLDEGIEGHASIIGAHRYVDGRPLSDFVHDGDAFSQNYGAERNYDPAIYGTGEQDLSKLPHAGLGKWINADPSWTLVPSTYSGDGFTPLAPGLGAIRIPMPAQAGVKDGSVVGFSGTLAANAMIFLPEPMFGRLGRLFIRYYFRLGSPYFADPAKRYHVYQDAARPEWTTYAGKFGIGPDHSTSTGGVSGSSGGGDGWQMRSSWYDCDAGTGGPDEGGWAPGFHLFDFNFRNPPGHNYGKGDGGISELWGMRGGTGGVLYADRWYCIETEIKLNTVMTSAPGYLADGELRAWIDGRLAYQRTGMVFRTLPIASYPYDPGKLRPCRELGVRGLWLNWFHGGKTVATIDRTTFYTGLVWARDYIGPMKL